MADIFISYSSKDAALAHMLYDTLSRSWDVWWDNSVAGRFWEVIEREVPLAKCIVPIWSTSARESGNVLSELELAKRSSLTIIPARTERCDPPFGYHDWSYVDLLDWKGEEDYPSIVQLKRKIETIIAPTKPPPRPQSIGDGRVGLPTLFQSVSSYETRLDPADAIRALRTFGAPTILVSAYDFVAGRHQIQKLKDINQLKYELSRFKKMGGFVLMDSGNYEATRLDDDKWKEVHFARALRNTPHDWALSFDVLEPSINPMKSVDQIVAAVTRNKKLTSAPILPIVHSPKRKEGGYNLSNLPTIARELAIRLRPPLIAIPERELGPGLVASALMMRRIRTELNKLHFYQPIHLLGTGNPWSIAVYTAAGADSYDGLEWCREVVDGKRGRLHHVQHFDFFKYQTRVANSAVTRESLENDEIGLAGKVAFHNLDFYADFSVKLQQATIEGKLEAFVAKWLERENAEQISLEFPELFR